MDLQVSDVVSFKESKFEVVEDSIVKGKQRRKALFRINLLSLLLLFGIFIIGFIVIAILHDEVSVSGFLWKILIVFGSYFIDIIMH